MADNKKRLTLDLDAPLQRRLKAVAALKGVSMRQYCQSAIENELDRDGINGTARHSQKRVTVDDLRALHKRLFGDRVLPGSSVDLIREAREIRDKELEFLY